MQVLKSTLFNNGESINIQIDNRSFNNVNIIIQNGTKQTIRCVILAN